MGSNAGALEPEKRSFAVASRMGFNAGALEPETKSFSLLHYLQEE
jgi:hypothetical protein